MGAGARVRWLARTLERSGRGHEAAPVQALARALGAPGLDGGFDEKTEAAA